MASEKQIAANRANALRSTGPRTSAGKQRSSRNAYQHGLSSPQILEFQTFAKIDKIVCELAGENATSDRTAAATGAAMAQIDLLRIRTTRANSVANADLHELGVGKLKRLAALDRYERYALTKRRKAVKKLRAEE